MTNLNGFFTIHRKLFEDPLWLNGTLLQKNLLILCIGKANHEPKQWAWQGKKFEVQRGQFITSLDSLKKEIGRGGKTQKIRTALNNLEKYGFLTNESTKTGRLITIVKYSQYQAIKNKSNKANNKDLTKTQQRPNKDLTPNNNDNNDNNDNNLYISTKTKYLDFVYLTQEEHKELIDRLGEDKTNDMIEKLNNYIGSKGKKYKSHYHTILNWVRMEEDKKKTKGDWKI